MMGSVKNQCLKECKIELATHKKYHYISNDHDGQHVVAPLVGVRLELARSHPDCAIETSFIEPPLI
jgi:hypothetical protein